MSEELPLHPADRAAYATSKLENTLRLLRERATRAEARIDELEAILEQIMDTLSDPATESEPANVAAYKIASLAFGDTHLNESK